MPLRPPRAESGSTRRVALLAPMPSELRPLVLRFGLARGDDGLRWGSVGGQRIVASLTGMGLRAGARAAEHILDAAAPDHLIVLGIAGGIGESVGIGDLVVPERVRNLDSGEELRPDPLGPATPRGILVSSDRLIASHEQASDLARQGVVAIDMETAAIGAVCRRHGCPWSVFRAISDRADDGSTDEAILGLADAQGRPRPGAVARFVLTRPRRIPQLARLARGARAAAHAAADAVETALRSPCG